MSSSGTPAPAPAPAPAPTTFGADPFFATLSPELQGSFKNKGWDAKTPAEAAAEAMKSYHEVEKHLGIPREQLVRLPKDANDKEGWAAFNTRIGVPAKAEEYDFSAVKFADGSDLDDEFVNTMRATLHENGVPKTAAPEVVKGIVKWMEGVEQSETAAKQAAVAAGRDELARSWGGNAEANKFIAQQAVAKLGLTPDFVQKIENEAGYAATMQTFLKLGQMMGEDKFVTNQNSNAPGVLTREQAEGRLAELKRDAGWVKKINDVDHKANDEINALTRIIALGAGQ